MSNTLTNVKDIKVAQRALQPFMSSFNKIFITLEFLYGFSAAKTDALKRIVKP